MVSDILAGMGKSLTFFYSVILDGDTVIERQAQEMHILLKSPLTTEELNRRQYTLSTIYMFFFVHSHLYAGAEGERKGEDDKEEGE